MTDFSFNGGGIGKGGGTYEATSGGGGTDIRLIKDSLYNRVIVAELNMGLDSITINREDKNPIEILQSLVDD